MEEFLENIIESSKSQHKINNFQDDLQELWLLRYLRMKNIEQNYSFVECNAIR